MIDKEEYSANFTNERSGRVYFVNQLTGKNDTPYVKITESRKVSDDEYQKNRILLFKEDLFKLSKVLNKCIKKIKENENDSN